MKFSKKDLKYIKNIYNLSDKKLIQLFERKDQLKISNNLQCTLNKIIQHGGSNNPDEIKDYLDENFIENKKSIKKDIYILKQGIQGVLKSDLISISCSGLLAMLNIIADDFTGKTGPGSIYNYYNNFNNLHIFLMQVSNTQPMDYNRITPSNIFQIIVEQYETLLKKHTTLNYVDILANKVKKKLPKNTLSNAIKNMFTGSSSYPLHKDGFETALGESPIFQSGYADGVKYIAQRKPIKHIPIDTNKKNNYNSLYGKNPYN